jgi:hypothetical protein
MPKSCNTFPTVIQKLRALHLKQSYHVMNLVIQHKSQSSFLTLVLDIDGHVVIGNIFVLGIHLDASAIFPLASTTSTTHHMLEPIERAISNQLSSHQFSDRTPLVPYLVNFTSSYSQPSYIYCALANETCHSTLWNNQSVQAILNSLHKICSQPRVECLAHRYQ